MKHPTALRNTQADAFPTSVDAGSGAGTVELYTGATDGAGTLLATFTLSDPSFGSASTGVATANSLPKATTGAATGTIGHAEIKDSAGTLRGSTADVGTSGTQVVVSTLSVVSGQPLSLTGLTYTIAAGT